MPVLSDRAKDTSVVIGLCGLVVALFISASWAFMRLCEAAGDVLGKAW